MFQFFTQSSQASSQAKEHNRLVSTAGKLLLDNAPEDHKTAFDNSLSCYLTYLDAHGQSTLACNKLSGILEACYNCHQAAAAKNVSEELLILSHSSILDVLEHLFAHTSLLPSLRGGDSIKLWHCILLLLKDSCHQNLTRRGGLLLQLDDYISQQCVFSVNDPDKPILSPVDACDYFARSDASQQLFSMVLNKFCILHSSAPEQLFAFMKKCSVIEDNASYLLVGNACILRLYYFVSLLRITSPHAYVHNAFTQFSCNMHESGLDLNSIFLLQDHMTRLDILKNHLIFLGKCRKNSRAVVDSVIDFIDASFHHIVTNNKKEPWFVDTLAKHYQQLQYIKRLIETIDTKKGLNDRINRLIATIGQYDVSDFVQPTSAAANDTLEVLSIDKTAYLSAFDTHKDTWTDYLAKYRTVVGSEHLINLLSNEKYLYNLTQTSVDAACSVDEDRNQELATLESTIVLTKDEHKSVKKPKSLHKSIAEQTRAINAHEQRLCNVTNISAMEQSLKSTNDILCELQQRVRLTPVISKKPKKSPRYDDNKIRKIIRQLPGLDALSSILSSTLHVDSLDLSEILATYCLFEHRKAALNLQISQQLHPLPSALSEEDLATCSQSIITLLSKLSVMRNRLYELRDASSRNGPSETTAADDLDDAAAYFDHSILQVDTVDPSDNEGWVLAGKGRQKK